MNKRNRSKVTSTPFSHNDQIHIRYEIIHGKDIIEPGDKILFKNTRGKFVFVKLVENLELDVKWIDCIDEKTLMFRSFYAVKLKNKVKPRKTRKPKIV